MFQIHYSMIVHQYLPDCYRMNELGTLSLGKEHPKIRSFIKLITRHSKQLTLDATHLLFIQAQKNGNPSQEQVDEMANVHHP